MLKLIHLPLNRWCLERADGTARSETFDYTSVGYWIHGPYLFVGYTAYYGSECVLMAMNPISIGFESVDSTILSAGTL